MYGRWEGHPVCWLDLSRRIIECCIIICDWDVYQPNINLEKIYRNNHHTVSRAEEYTDWEARAAACDAAKELLGLDLSIEE